ncbi:hypothetical protein BYT27DRAFT_7279137 [Phlegmacium glaucopus]|nr:hypothetical protein BYT27DRAFT_7279137 [Phlegmacium glaucopus]
MVKAIKATKSKLPDIPWAEDDYKLISAFLMELEKTENYKVLFGKKDPSENTSGESQVSVFNEQLKGQLDRLTKTYHKHAAQLHQTGDGIDGGNVEHFDYYILAEGPNEGTPLVAVNIWEDIEKDFKFFPRLHKIFSARPNVVLIAITTALGPYGQRTVWYQSPNNKDSSVPAPITDSQIDPQLLRISEPDAPPTPPRTFGTNITAATANVTPQAVSTNRVPKPSIVSREAIEKARLSIQKVPQKHSLLDTLVELHDKNNQKWSEENLAKLNIQKRGQILEEFKLDIWTKEEYLEQVRKLEGGSEPAPKCQKTYYVSPDWDDDAFYASS